MQKYNQIDIKNQGFWLHFRASGDGSGIAEYKLPTPNYYNRSNEATYTVAWLLDGYFGTIKGRVYLNDIIARLTMGMQITNRLDFAPKTENMRACKLQLFQNLPSLPRRTEQIPNTTKYDDAIFWAIKLEAIARIRISDGWIDHDSLQAWAFDLFITKAKDHSTLKAKVRNVWEWYKDRDWKIETRNFTMTRSEAGRATAEKNAKATEAKVRGAVEALKFLQEKITITAVCKHASVSPNTATKYIKQLKEQGAL